MTPLPLDFSGTDKPRQIQENLMAYMRLFAGFPDTFMVDNESFWFISNKPAPGNIILRTHLNPNRTEEQIDTTLEQIGQYIDQIGWFVFPGDQPVDLSDRLNARGMPGGRGGYWLWADLTRESRPPTAPKDFRVERVTNDVMMAEWTPLSEAGFGGELSIFYDAYARHGYGPDAFSLHYIGYQGDTAVTTGTLLDAGACAAIYDVSTPPAFRKQGFGGALTHAMMQGIRQRGYADTWIWASELGMSVYESLGYVEADFGLREHRWHKKA